MQVSYYDLFLLIVASVTIGILVHCIWASYRKPHAACKALNNLHNFQLTAAQYYDGNLGPMTFVLSRCPDCGLHASHAVPGTWPLEDLRKNPDDVSELERMAKL